MPSRPPAPVVGGLTGNGVEVTACVAAELDRRHPERAQLAEVRDVAGFRAMGDTVESSWDSAFARVEALPAGPPSSPAAPSYDACSPTWATPTSGGCATGPAARLPREREPRGECLRDLVVLEPRASETR